MEETWFEGPSLGVMAQSPYGGLEILPGHTSFLAILTMGPLVVRQVETAVSGGQSIFFISGGIVHVTDQEVIILADDALRSRDLDEASADRARLRALEQLSNQKDSVNYSEVLREIALAREQLRVIRMSKQFE